MITHKMADQQGGHEAEFVDEVPDRYICNICTKPLNAPQLMVCCGQHYCHSCLEQWFEGQWKIQSCPHCRAEGDKFQHVINKSLQREILSLKVKCCNHQEGCHWIGELGLLNDHLVPEKGCGYVEVECPNECVEIVDLLLRKQQKIKMKRKDLDTHLKEECYNRQYKCEHCDKRAKYIEITGVGSNFAKDCHHYQKCKEILTDCPNKCSTGRIKRKNIANHRAECPLECVYCPNKCVTQIQFILGEDGTTKMLRKDLENHLNMQCYLRPYKCEYCNQESTYEAITGNGIRRQPTNHYDDCKEFPLPCPNNCGVNNIRRKNMEVHRLDCPEETVQCPNKCIQSLGGMKRKDLQKHVTEECLLRPHVCEHCARGDSYTAITKHYASCPKYPLECPNKCGATRIMRKNMTYHRNKCQLQPVECPFAEAGCKTKLVRQDLEKHSTATQQQHLFMVMETLKLMKQEHQKELQQTKTELEGVKTQLNKTREEQQKTNSELKETKKELAKTNRELRETKEKVAQDTRRPSAFRQPAKTKSSSVSRRGRGTHYTQQYPRYRQDDRAYESDYPRHNPMDDFDCQPRHHGYDSDREYYDYNNDD